MGAGFSPAGFSGAGAGASVFTSFFFDAPGAAGTILLSVLYHPLPLKCTAGGEINFSVIFDPHAEHFGRFFDPNGSDSSNVVLHFLQRKSKRGIHSL